MGRSKQPTIEDVAAECGLSRATVSRVINRSGVVKAATVDKVEQALAKLGYVANASARILSGGSSMTLAVVLPEIWRPYYATLLQGVEEAASQRDYNVLIKTINRRDSLLNLVRLGQIDGLLFRNTLPSTLDTALYRELDRMDVPYVQIGNAMKRDSIASVTIDNIGGGRTMAHHLVDRGYRSVLFITGPADNVDSSDRIWGFKLGWAERGMDEAAIIFREGDYSKESGYGVAATFFEQNDVDAVFAVNDRMALGVLLYVKACGRTVPQDVAIAGFDDDFFSEYLTPSLTTVRQPMYDMGFRATNNLILLLEGSPLKNQHVILSAELVAREST